MLLKQIGSDIIQYVVYISLMNTKGKGGKGYGDIYES